LAGLAIAFFLARVLSKPILQINNAARRIASGKYDVKLDIHTNDELQELGVSFQTMVLSIIRMMGEIKATNEVTNKLLGDVSVAKQETDTARQTLEEEVEMLSEFIDILASGDFSRDVLTNSRSEEIARLRERLKRMVEGLRFLISQVHEAVDTVMEATGQISSSAEQLSHGARSQAQQTGEVAVSMDSISEITTNNSHNATQTATVAVKNGEIARRSSDIVLQTVTKMKEIATVVQASSATIGQLGDASEEIGEIVQVIEEIADQTNLLALNAAIEAARAGDQGRGFAVVADEVRKLAERTQQATKQITGMITTIQRESKGAVDAMQQGSHKVGEGIGLAERAGEALHEVLQSSESVLQMVQSIADAGKQQAAGSEAIAQNVDQIAAVALQSAEGVAHIAQTAATLHDLTQSLDERIAQFKVPYSTMLKALPPKDGQPGSRGNGSGSGSGTAAGFPARRLNS
jgi:methyl-accepting chemotaxis protein